MPVKSVRLRPVSELYMQCSYPMRPDAMAASDTCRRPADTAVVKYLPFDDEAYYWRCGAHRGLLSDGQVSTIVAEVPYRG